MPVFLTSELLAIITGREGVWGGDTPMSYRLVEHIVMEEAPGWDIRKMVLRSKL